MKPATPANLRRRVASLERAIRLLERAHNNLRAAYRKGEFGELEDPMTALDVALSNADDLLDLMHRAVGGK